MSTRDEAVGEVSAQMQEARMRDAVRVLVRYLVEQSSASRVLSTEKDRPKQQTPLKSSPKSVVNDARE